MFATCWSRGDWSGTAFGPVSGPGTGDTKWIDETLDPRFAAEARAYGAPPDHPTRAVWSSASAWTMSTTVLATVSTKRAAASQLTELRLSVNSRICNRSAASRAPSNSWPEVDGEWK